MPNRYIFSLLLLIACNETVLKQEPETTTSAIQKEKDSLTYQQFQSLIDSTRLSLRKIYSIDAQKAIAKIKDYLVQIIGSDFYHYWQGTPWDYNGITNVPKEGKIACGFFVTTVLKHAGVKLNRYKLAVCPSLTMMKKLTSPQSIKNLSALSCEGFVDWLKNQGKSVFIVGLDYHTGFIVNDGEGCWFIHSNYINKIGVTKEKVSQSIALEASKGRYVTCLTDSETFLKGWLFN